MAKITAARWAELSPHLDELLTLPPPDRLRWLDVMIAYDPIAASEPKDLRAGHDSASRHAFLGGVADRALPVARVAAGDRLGAWERVEPIGEGGRVNLLDFGIAPLMGDKRDGACGASLGRCFIVRIPVRYGCARWTYPPLLPHAPLSWPARSCA